MKAVRGEVVGLTVTLPEATALEASDRWLKLIVHTRQLSDLDYRLEVQGVVHEIYRFASLGVEGHVGLVLTSADDDKLKVRVSYFNRVRRTAAEIRTALEAT